MKTSQMYGKEIFAKHVEEGRPKWAPEVKWATPIIANMVKAMAKKMMPDSSPSRERGTMECVTCELQHKTSSDPHNCDFSVFDKIFDTNHHILNRNGDPTPPCLEAKVGHLGPTLAANGPTLVASTLHLAYVATEDGKISRVPSE